MKKSELIICVIILIASLVHCVPRRRKSITIQKFHRTGEAVAVDNLIAKYENEHQKFYKEQTKKGDHLEWPALYNKDLSIYCKKYLQHITPGKKSDGVIGTKMGKTLNYKKECTGTTNEIVVVQCKITFKSAKLNYYMTRAPEPNCVYALKCSGGWTNHKYTIIYKYCDFEYKSLIDSSLKRKRSEVVGGMHCWTGQLIAKVNYLLEYEMEHQRMVKCSGEEGKCIQWPYAMAHRNLDLYCNQYLGKCSDRNQEGVSGKWRTEKLHYEKLNAEEVDVTIVTCFLKYASTKLNYYTTRAPDNNCVYALLRKGHKVCDPFVIIFKHCNFEDQPHVQKSMLQDNVNFDTNLVQKAEVKEETFFTVEALPLFPED